MSWLNKKGINLRATLAFVTDPAGSVCLSQDPVFTLDIPAYSGADASGPLTLDSDTFSCGWVLTSGGANVSSTDGCRDRTTGVDKRLAGRQCSLSATACSLKLQCGISPGQYKIWIGATDQGNGTPGAVSITVRDAGGTLATISSGAALTANQVLGADNTVYSTAAAWAATSDTSGNSITVTSTDTSNGNGGPLLFFDCGASNAAPLAHVAVQFLGAGPLPPTAPLALGGNAPTIISGTVISPLVARVKREFERAKSGLLIPSRKIFLPSRSFALAY